MGKKRSSAKETYFEMFFCTVDAWNQSLSIGVNRHKSNLFPENVTESSEITVEGAIRKHCCPRGRKRSNLSKVAVVFLPSEKPPSTWEVEVERIGNVWTEGHTLRASAWISKVSFAALGPALLAGKFKELTLSVKDLRYGKGMTDSVSLSAEPTSFEEDE